MAYSLVRPLVVLVGHEALMARIRPSLVRLRSMESLVLANRRWAPYACDDMLNPVSTAELLSHRSEVRAKAGET